MVDPRPGVTLVQVLYFSFFGNKGTLNIKPPSSVIMCFSYVRYHTNLHHSRCLTWFCLFSLFLEPHPHPQLWELTHQSFPKGLFHQKTRFELPPLLYSIRLRTPFTKVTQVTTPRSVQTNRPHSRSVFGKTSSRFFRLSFTYDSLL